MKIKIYLSIFILFFMVVVSGVSGAALVNDLIITPTADIYTGVGVISGEVVDKVQRVEAIFHLNPSLEVGGEVISYDGGNSELGVMVKLALMPETETQPALAGGIKGRDLYIVASKKLGYGFRGHLGVGNDHFGGLFFGVNKLINPVSVEISDDEGGRVSSSSFPPMNLMAEYIDKKINLGLRLNLDQSLYFDLAVMDLDSLKVGLIYGF